MLKIGERKNDSILSLTKTQHVCLNWLISHLSIELDRVTSLEKRFPP